MYMVALRRHLAARRSSGCFRERIRL